MERPIDKAIQIAGGQSALARLVGVRPQAVQQWVASGVVPPRRCRSIEAAVEGQVSRHELRPDIYGERPIQTPAPTAEPATAG